MSKTLVFFGNELLNKYPFEVETTTHPVGSGQSIQDLDLPRGSGSSVVNTRREKKVINVKGRVKISDTFDNIESVITEQDKALNQDGEHILRTVNQWEYLHDATALTWDQTGDLTVPANTSDNWQIGTQSVEFDLDPSSGGSQTGSIYATAGTAKNLSTYVSANKLYNLEFWLFIPEALYIEKLRLRIGNDSSNYYETEFRSNYEEQRIKNGWNFFSIDLYVDGDSWAETGTVSNNAIDYLALHIDHTAGSDLLKYISGILLSGFIITKEERVRNYPAFKVGETQRSGNSYEISYHDFEASFLNYTGYAQSTHYFDIFDEDGVNTNTDDQFMSLEGSIDLQPLFTVEINTATNIESLRIKNLVTDKSVNFIPSSISAGDIFTFGGLQKEFNKNGQPVDFDGVIPNFGPYHQRARLSIEGVSPTVIQQTTTNATLQLSSIGTEFAQSFTTGSAGVLASLSFGLNYGEVNVLLYSDNSGSPGTLLQILGKTIGGVLNGLSYSLSGATKYWLACEMSNGEFGQLQYNTAGGLANADLKTKSYPSTTYGSSIGDAVFSVQLGQTPAWDVGWSARYKKLYSA